METPTTEMYISFFKFLKDKSNTMAIDLINAELDDNTPWEKIFEKDDEGNGFNLDSESTGPNEFRINFDCVVEEGMGDGGVWNVKFNNKGEVVTCDSENEWVG